MVPSGKYTVMEEKTKEYSTRMQLHIKDFQVKVFFWKISMSLYSCIYIPINKNNNNNDKNNNNNTDNHDNNNNNCTDIIIINLEGVWCWSLHLHINQFFGQVGRHYSAVSK